MTHPRESIGPFEIRGMLGRGAMAVVWLGYDPSLDREVAIKEPVLPPGGSDEMRLEYGRRFVREARAAARLNHPGIVTVHSAGVYDSRPVIVMEFVQGATLRDVLRRGKLTAAQTSALMERLLQAVAYAHEHGVTHRDLKPDNVFVTLDGAVKLADFGIAQLGDAGAEADGAESTHARALTREGTMLGTPAYMSPERIRGERVDGRCDVFALGVIAYECLAGSNPFGSESSTHYATIIHRIINEPTPPLTMRDEVTGPLAEVVMKALEKRPDDRYADAGAMLAAWHGAAPSRTVGRAELAALCVAAGGEARQTSGPTPSGTQMWGPAVARAQTPVTKVSGGDDSWHNSDVSLELMTGGTEGLAHPQYRLDDGPWTEGHTVIVSAPPGGANDGVHTIAFRSMDSTGLVEAPRTTQVRIDTCPPTTVLIGADDAWHNEDVHLRLSASDAQSGVAVTEHRIDDGPWIEGTSAVVPVAGGAAACGDHIVSYRSRDVAGNVEETKKVRVRIDASPPLTIVEGADERWHATDVVLRFTATDHHSGVAGTAYKIDDGAWVEGNAVVVPAKPGGANDGAHTISYRARDNAGNVEPVQTVVARIDTAPPVTDVKGADEVRRDGRVTLRFSARDAHSDIAFTEYRLDGGPWTKGTSAVVPGKPAGTHTIAFRSADAAGNIEGERVLRIETGPGTAAGRRPASPSRAQRRRRGLLIMGAIAAVAAAVAATIVVAGPFGSDGPGPTPTPTPVRSLGPDPTVLAKQAQTLAAISQTLQTNSASYADIVKDIESKAEQNSQALKAWQKTRGQQLKDWEAAKALVDDYNAKLPPPTPAHTEWTDGKVWDEQLQQWVNGKVPKTVAGSTPTPRSTPSQPAPPPKVNLSLKRQREDLARIAAAVQSASTDLAGLVTEERLVAAKPPLAAALALLGERIKTTRSALKDAILPVEAGDRFDEEKLGDISTDGVSAAAETAREALQAVLEGLGLPPTPSPRGSPTPPAS